MKSAAVVLIVCLACQAVAAQAPVRTPSPGAMAVEEASALSYGWSRLAAGDPSGALSAAVSLLARVPESGAARILAIQAEIAGPGAVSALTRYETWMTTRSLEEPAMLRAIARAMLYEFAAQPENPRGQAAALLALAESGDATAAERLHTVAAAGNVGARRALAELADPKSITTLIGDLNRGQGNKLSIMAALGASGSAAALGPLAAQLADPEEAVRGEAAEALGRLGSHEAITHLSPLLADRSGYVRAKAAGALLRLGDESGVPFLQALASEPAATSRIVAAEGFAARPDEAWLTLVRGLAGDPTPDIRLSAAELLAPHDPDAARSILQELAASDNPSIREEALESIAIAVPSDLATLRNLLKAPDRLVRIAAAGKILTLTR
jgi:HEAT repeat protein